MAISGELGFLLKGLSIAAFILPDGKKPTKLRVLWFLLVQIPYLLIHILAVVFFIVEPYVLKGALLAALVSNNGFQTMVRPAHLIIFKKKVEQMLAIINTPRESESREFNLEEQEMRKNSKKRIFKFSLILYFYNAIVYAEILIPSIIRCIRIAYCDQRRNLNLEECKQPGFVPLFLYNYWWFTDRFALPTFYFLFAYQVLMLWVYVSSFCSSDAFICSVMLALAERSKFLARIAPVALIPGEGGEMTPYFKAWIKYHQQYYRLTHMMNNNLGPVVFVTHVFAALNIMIFSFVIVRDEDPQIRRTAMFFLVALGIQFFLFAYSGQKIIDKSEELGRSVLAATQISAGTLKEGPCRSALLVVMARSCGLNSDEITGLGYFTISMRFYARIFSVSASYLLFMLQLK